MKVVCWLRTRHTTLGKGNNCRYLQWEQIVVTLLPPGTHLHIYYVSGYECLNRNCPSPPLAPWYLWTQTAWGTPPTSLRGRRHTRLNSTGLWVSALAAYVGTEREREKCGSTKYPRMLCTYYPRVLVSSWCDVVWFVRPPTNLSIIAASGSTFHLEGNLWKRIVNKTAS